MLGWITRARVGEGCFFYITSFYRYNYAGAYGSSQDSSSYGQQQGGGSYGSQQVTVLNVDLNLL